MARIYIAKYGDSLSGIAQKYGVDLDILRQYNHIGSGDHFCVGENIYIDEERKINIDETSNTVTITRFGLIADSSGNPELEESYKKQIQDKYYKQYYDEFYEKYKNNFVKKSISIDELRTLHRSEVNAEVDSGWGLNDTELGNWFRGIAGQIDKLQELINNKRILTYSLIHLRRNRDNDWPLSVFLCHTYNYELKQDRFYVLDCKDGQKYFDSYKGPKIIISSTQANGSSQTMEYYNQSIFPKDFIPPKCIVDWKFGKPVKSYTVVTEYCYINNNAEIWEFEQPKEYSGAQAFINIDLKKTITYTKARIQITPKYNDNTSGETLVEEYNISSVSEMNNGTEDDISELEPNAPRISLSETGNYTIECSVNPEDIPDSVNKIVFNIYKNDDTAIYKTGTLTSYYASKGRTYSVKNVEPDSVYTATCYYIGSSEDKRSKDSKHSDAIVSPPKVPVIKSITPSTNDSGSTDRSITVVWKAANKKTKYTIEYVKENMELYKSIENHFYAVNSDKTSIEVEFDKTSDAQYDTENQEMTKTISGFSTENGGRYYLRIKGTNDRTSILGGSSATNSSSATSDWSDPTDPLASFIIGTKPSAPTIWSSTNTAVIGEPLNLYWSQNSTDNSRMTKSFLSIVADNLADPIEIELTTDDEYDNNYVHVLKFEKKDNARQANIKTSAFPDGSKIKWRVKTAGISNEYGDFSEEREINIYAKPIVSVILEDSKHNEIADTIDSFPMYISLQKDKPTLNQKIIGFNVNIENNSNYQYIDSAGNIKNLTKGSTVYSKNFDISYPYSDKFGYIYSEDEEKFKIEGYYVNNKFYSDSKLSNIIRPSEDILYIALNQKNGDRPKKYIWNEVDRVYEEVDEFMFTDGNKSYPYFYPYYNSKETKLYIKLTCSDVDLINGIEYLVRCSMIMDSGLVATDEITFIPRFTEILYKPTATVSIDEESLTAIIKPSCEYQSYTIDCYIQDNKAYQDINCSIEIGLFPDSIYYDHFTEKYYIYKLVSGSIDEYSFEESPNPLEDAILSVFRKELDGTFTEIDRNISNDSGYEVIDPHPSLAKAIYRIVSESKTTGAISYSDTEPVEIKEKALVIQFNNYTLKLPYNISVSNGYSPDISLVEYIGRKHPVSYYGTQLGETMSWRTVIPKSDHDTLNLIRELAIYMGDVYVREPSGTGYWANISVDFSQSYDDLTIPLSFSITRVEGGM